MSSLVGSCWKAFLVQKGQLLTGVDPEGKAGARVGGEGSNAEGVDRSPRRQRRRTGMPEASRG